VKSYGLTPFFDPFLTPFREEALDRLTMWMMFRPPGGMLVPLRAVDWYWHGVATNGPSGWALSSDPGNHSVNPQDYDVQTYPLWNSSARSSHVEPPF